MVGIGPGNGAAFARRFAREGYQLALLSRTTELSAALAAEIGEARAYACDAADKEAVARTFAAIRHDLGEVDVLIYNAGSGVWGSVEDITPEQFESSWRINTLGALLASQQVIASMKQRKRGTILFIGATASRRGGPRTAAFAPAKAAQRSLAESMARSLWPAGVHVALLSVDAVIDIPTTRARMPDKSDDFFAKPDDIADHAYRLTQQPRSTWAFEVEIRPFGETW